MITVGIINGFESTEVILLSQELDLLIYEFQKQLNSQQYNLQRLFNINYYKIFIYHLNESLINTKY